MSIKETFRKFWADNIKTNYKKISVAIGVATNSITSAVIAYFISQCLLIGDINLGLLIVGILIPLQGLLNLLCFYVFGKATDGNGYGVPETHVIVDVIKKDTDLQDYIKEKVIEYAKKSKLLNGNK